MIDVKVETHYVLDSFSDATIDLADMNLSLRAVAAYLQPFDDEDVVGLSGIPFMCPVAHMLHEQGYNTDSYRLSVFPQNVQICTSAEEYVIQTPASLAEFIRGIDLYGDLIQGSPVSASVARSVLANVMAKTEPSPQAELPFPQAVSQAAPQAAPQA